MFNFIKKLFESKYNPYLFHRIDTVKEEIMADNPNGVTDPLDVGCVHTGKYRDVKYEIWVRYHKKSNLPQYKKVRLP